MLWTIDWVFSRILLPPTPTHTMHKEDLAHPRDSHRSLLTLSCLVVVDVALAEITALLLVMQYFLSRSKVNFPPFSVLCFPYRYVPHNIAPLFIAFPHAYVYRSLHTRVRRYAKKISVKLPLSEEHSLKSTIIYERIFLCNAEGTYVLFHIPNPITTISPGDNLLS